jgi:RNA polymerase sigma factor (sigma-70 family)
MIRRWFRALSGTGIAGRPYLASPTVGRRPRTLLRLEVVEDRTLASAVPTTLPEQSTPAPEGRVASDSSAKGSDDDKQTSADASVDLPTEGFHFGWDQTGPHQKTIEAATGVGSNVLSASGFNGFNGFTPVELPAPVVAQGTALEPSGSAEKPSATGKSARDADPSVTVDSSTATSAASGESQTPSDGKGAVADGRVAPSSTGGAAVNVTTVGGSNTTVFGSHSGDGQPHDSQVNVDAGRPLSSASPRLIRSSQVQSAGPNQPATADLPDGALLQRFAFNRDQAAFTALVQRHGRLVLNVCQRVLGDFHAAQDASQATFLVLARKAGMLDRSTPLGGWLYKVAYHLALRSRAMAARQRIGEQEAADELAGRGVNEDVAGLDQRELHQVIREELQALPEKYRAPLTLCYLDGRSHADAAREIGLPRGSMAKRVGEGLERLRERLLHRGLVL